ncbi:nickel-responsive transcriptional regulator NikR [Rubritalea spongiae]|uniref:Putative nickel-responsive regulator n=1 Tax=Rubritalea spongiae TaxID=430797 RepID=A0ABW5E0V2_9BACT
MERKKLKKEKVKRISVSLSPEVYQDLDKYTQTKGFQSRSQAISEMINQSLIASCNHYGDDTVAGTITLVYDESRIGLLENISKIQREYIDEVISSQHVLLEDDNTMEVLLVQGPASKLRAICDRLTSCKGVRTGNLALTSIIMPPIHPRSNNSSSI